MPLFHLKTNKPNEPNSEIVDTLSSDEEGFVKVNIKSTRPNKNKEGDAGHSKVEFKLLTVSEFLTELERLHARPSFVNKKKVVDGEVDNSEDIDEALQEPGEDRKETRRLSNQKEENEEEKEKEEIEQSPSLTASPALSWDSEFGELLYISDDSIWDSFYSSRAQPPKFRYPSIEVPGQATKQPNDSCEYVVEESTCDHEECDHGSHVACSECCTCASKTRDGWVLVPHEELPFLHSSTQSPEGVLTRPYAKEILEELRELDREYVNST